MRWRAIAVGIVATVLLITTAPAARNDPPDPPETESGVWNDVVALYEAAKNAGEQVPKNVYDWARQDLDHHGDWEYHVVELKSTPAKMVESRLNALGAERWECIWVESSGNNMRLFFKRPAKSYLRNLPLSELWKLVPGAGPGEEP